MLWHIERNDALRVSTASRAAIVLTANTVLLTGSLTFIWRFVFAPENTSQMELVLSILIFPTLLFILASVVFAMSAIISIRRSARQLFGNDIPKAPYFNPRDTVEPHANFQEFKEGILSTHSEEMLTYALSELWIGVNQHFYRYQKLRKSIKFFFAAISTSLLTVALSIAWRVLGFYL